ncbi:hypothetical protein Zm00014a_042138 [Zea mays]|uniref:Protein neuralized n=2 Tax=Zea mays TaxID=4577 RepID=A0A317YM05_MAIZE|nr:Protein neuralized [Zea mays]PWZ58962.1 hypothetical protein Zm00014a_042138 [Zea mays]
MNDERPISGQLRQSHPVSTVREEVRSGAERSITSSHQSALVVALSTPTNPTDNEYDDASATPQQFAISEDENATVGYEILTQESVQQDEGSRTEDNVADRSHDFAQEQTGRYSGSSSEQDSHHYSSSYAFPSNNALQREAETRRGGQEQIGLAWSSRDASGIEDGDGDGNTFVHGDDDEEWLVIDSQEPRPNWQPAGHGFASSRNTNRLRPADGDVYGVELRELLSRRSVSNLLSSGFRESLDQLIRSYVQRQEHEWNLEGQIPATTGPGSSRNEDHIEIRIIDEQNRGDSDTAPQSSSSALSPADRTQQRQWAQQTMHHRSEFVDWDAIHILRDELSGVQRGMSSMQQMLEACMEMQIEMQRSIRQEVSAALNRSLTTRDEEETLEGGSQWKLARKGTCCICCDSQIDSLLYRCGHMCTCSKCASELLHGAGRCPLCRAPIIEAIRAYCIL